VAFKAEQVGLRPFQQPRICGSVRSVAGAATFCLDWLMFEHKGPCFIRVATEADLVLRGGRAQLLGQEPAMLIVTISALNQTFLDTMAERAVEVLLHIGMAAIA
jgi:hypothetical protein